MLRFRFAQRAVAATAFAFVLSATPASADNVFKRAGSSIGAFFKRIGQAFRREPLDPNLVAALDSYEKGDYFTTYLYAEKVKGSGAPRYGDEADTLMGLAAADGGLQQAAAAHLRSTLEATPVELGDLAEIAGIPDEGVGRLAAKNADRDTLAETLAAPLAPDAARHERLVALGKDQLGLWREYRAHLVRDAVESEQQAVAEIRFKLEFELSQTLGNKRTRESKAIEGS